MASQLYLLITLFLLAVCTAGARSDTTRVDLYYGIAEGNYLIGDLQGATKGVEQIFKIEPDHIPALSLYTRIHMDQGKSADALKAVDRAIALEPSNLQHCLLKALVLGNMNRREDARHLIEQIMQRARVESDDYRVASQLLGLLLMADGNWDAAAGTFNQLYLENPESAAISLELAGEAYLGKANDALNQGAVDAAIDAIDQALQVDAKQPGNTNFTQATHLRMIRARMLTQAGRIDAAITDLQHITGRQPDHLEALVTLASLYASAGRWRALEAVIAPIAAHPELQDIALYLEGRAALAKGRAGTAREKFEQARNLLVDGPSPLRSSLEFYHGVCLNKTGRPATGDAEIVQALDGGFRPETTDEAILASRALLRAHKAHAAITILEAITLNPLAPSAEAWTLLGRAHKAEGSTALALSAFNQSLSIEATQADTLALRASLLRKLGDFEGAAADTESAIILDPDNPALTYSLGLIYFQAGNLHAAEQSIRHSAAHLQDNPGLYLLHALLAHSIDAPTIAQAALNHYLALVPEQSNESAIYLEYTLNAQKDPEAAVLRLQQRIEAGTPSPALRNFLWYSQQILDRKAVLDAAGRAETPAIAQRQLCEAAYWLAQHEQALGKSTQATELLQLACQIGTPDMPEFQLAQWQLKQ